MCQGYIQPLPAVEVESIADLDLGVALAGPIGSYFAEDVVGNLGSLCQMLQIQF